ncbi:MAG: hypothetical protein QX189_17355 [Methylococcales bacterium]
MTLMEKCKDAIKTGSLPPIFSQTDLHGIGLDKGTNNLPNYDKGSNHQTNKKVLISRIINGETYYSFDKEVLPDVPSGYKLNRTETIDGKRCYSGEPYVL